MKVTKAEPKMAGANLSNEKELVRAWSLVCPGVDCNGKPCIVEPIVVRWWMGRSSSASRVYCTVWIHSRSGAGSGGIDAAGHGWAGGHGYDKYSAAFEAACDAAGFEFDAGIGGVGDQAVRAAMEALADAAGIDPLRYIVRHG